MRTKTITLFLILVMSMFFPGCSSKIELPYQGLFYKTNGEFVEIPLSDSYPMGVSRTDPIINNTALTLYFNYSNSNIGDILWKDLTRQSGVSFTINELDNNIFELQPTSELRDGDYCLVSSDLLIPSELLDRWCFRIGDPSAIEATASALNAILEQKMNVSPSGEGMFYVNDDLSTSEIFLERLPINYHDLSDYTSLMPVSITPVMLLRSYDIDIDNFELFRGRPLAGIRLETDSSPCTSAGGNLREGAKILAVDTIEISTCDEMIEILRTKKPMDDVVMRIQIGTAIENYLFPLESVTFDQSIPISIEWGNGYVSIIPQENLVPGVYCYAERGWASGYCFRVEEGISSYSEENVDESTASTFEAETQSRSENQADQNSRLDILYTSNCDPRTDSNFCNHSDSLEVFSPFYEAIENVNGSIIYEIPNNIGEMNQYDVIIANFCGFSEDLNYLLTEFVNQGGGLIVIADNFCSGTASDASELTQQWGITFTNDDDFGDHWSSYIAEHDITVGVSSIYSFRPAYLSVQSPGNTVVEMGNNSFIAIYENVGKVVVIPSTFFIFDLNSRSEGGTSDNFILLGNIFLWLSD